MKINTKKITVRELVNGYVNNDEEGVVGFGGKLNIRPKYQREFVYNLKQQEAVINTIRKGFPINTMYWVDGGNGEFEVLDGQQRTLSICSYVTGGFSVNFQFFYTLEEEEKNVILDYEIDVYVCVGEGREKLDWFETINIAGEKLTEQELNNAAFTGEWLSDAKRHFSRNNCVAYNLAKDYVSGSPIRQELLSTALKWISEDNVKKYMSEHQKDPNANELWLYFSQVINWAKVLFPTQRKEMKSVNWGKLFNEFGTKSFDSKVLEAEVVALLKDEDVTKKSGVYTYVLTRNPKHLSIRAFSTNQKVEAYEKQKGICPVCGNHFKLEEMEADHITPWSEGGKTNSENCQMLCKADNRTKSNK